MVTRLCHQSDYFKIIFWKCTKPFWFVKLFWMQWMAASVCLWAISVHTWQHPYIPTSLIWLWPLLNQAMYSSYKIIQCASSLINIPCPSSNCVNPNDCPTAISWLCKLWRAEQTNADGQNNHNSMTKWNENKSDYCLSPKWSLLLMRDDENSHHLRSDN